MGRINWARVFLCGLLAGGVWTLLSAVLVAFLGEEFLAAVTGGRQIVPEVHLFLFLSNIVSAIWAMWLYAAIRPRYGAGPRTAVLAGLAWWVIATMQSAKWVALLSIPPRLVVPLATNLVAMIVAALVGAWPYEEKASLEARDR